MKKIKVNIYLKQEIYDYVKAESKRRGMSMSGFIESVLEKDLESWRKSRSENDRRE